MALLLLLLLKDRNYVFSFDKSASPVKEQTLTLHSQSLGNAWKQCETEDPVSKENQTKSDQMSFDCALLL